MNRLLLLMVFLSFLCFSTISRAQTLSGKITDAETHQPLEAVMISVLRGNMMIDYTLTDAKGQYSLPWKHNGTLNKADCAMYGNSGMP